MRTTVLPASLAVLLLALTPACNKQPEPIPNDKPADRPEATTTTSSGNAPAQQGAHPPAGAAGAGAATAAGAEDIAWDAPTSWVSAPNPNTMRKATYKIPKAGGEAEDAELTVSAASGGVEPNVKRWAGQFGDAPAKTELRTVNGLKVTIVEIKGKLAGGGMMGQPAPAKDGQMLLGAIVDAGDRQHFFKMVGGEKTVTAARKDFDKLVSTLRAK